MKLLKVHAYLMQKLVCSYLKLVNNPLKLLKCCGIGGKNKCNLNWQRNKKDETKIKQKIIHPQTKRVSWHKEAEAEDAVYAYLKFNDARNQARASQLRRGETYVYKQSTNFWLR